MIEFDWNTEKARKNLIKHAVSFEEAQTVFYDFLSITISDPIHSIEEERLITIGMSSKQRLLVVVHTEINDRIRIISSRLTTKIERKKYEEENY